MRKILITEEQERIINEAKLSAGMQAALPSFVVDSINSPLNPLASTGYFANGVLKKMVSSRNEEINAYFLDDINSYPKGKVFSKLSKLIAKCKEKEEPIRDSLERICFNTVCEIFAIPDNSVEINCKLVSEIPASHQFLVTPDTDEDYEYDSISAMESSDSEIRKRKIINALACGAAERIAEQSRKLWVNDVFELDEELPHLYSKIMKINEYLVFNTDVQITDKSHKQGGSVETRPSPMGELAKINTSGIIFPVLLQETIRGVIEMLSSYGLPDDKDSARRVANIADALENDPWNMRVGAVMWDCICGSVNKFDSKHFPYFFKELVSLPTNEFESVMKEVFAKTKVGREKVNGIYNQSRYDDEYDKFSADIAAKQERDVIEDDYFSEEELEEGLYGYDEE